MTTAARSLAARLVLVLALVQTASVVLGMAAWMAFSPYVSWTDVAHRSAAGRVAESLAGDAAAAEALRRYAAARPGFQHAASVAGRIVDSSGPEIAALLATLGPTLPREGQIDARMPDGGLIRFSSLPSPAGEVIVATAGDRFRAEDLMTFLGTYLPELFPLFAPAILAAAIAVPLAVRLILRPLRQRARDLAEIDLRSLDRRLPDRGTPSEIAPFCDAINALLARLEDGVARQRLFTANAAHELRTPVAVLQARLDALPEDRPERAALLRDIRRITVLLDQLLSVARLGQRSPAAAPLIDLVSLARRVAADCAPLGIAAGRDIVFEPRAQALPIQGDPQAIEGALAALIENALRAEPEGGTVGVGVGPGPLIAVVDHGPGVPAAQRELIFEPFWRADPTTRGTGLGLAIVREVARLHAGAVDVVETPGGGATFRLLLPGLPAPAGLLAADAGQDASHHAQPQPS